MARNPDNLPDVFKLVLGLQLLVRRQFRLLARYYAVLAVIAGVLCGLTAWMVARWRPVVQWPGVSLLLVGLGCAALVLFTYVLTRWVGTACVLLLAAVLVGTITITPQVRGITRAPPSTADDDLVEEGLSTGDFRLFLHGAGTCIAMSALAGGVWRLVAAPRRSHWPPRRAVCAALAVSGVAALELLRIATRLGTGTPCPWQGLAERLVLGPGWPYALAVWLCMAVGCFLGLYDNLLLPYLLRRNGQKWVQHPLHLHEAYMVDELLEAIIEPRGPLRFRSRSGR